MQYTRRNEQKRRAGFTLVELLVVIAIIGILAGIVVPNVVIFLKKGKNAAAISEIRNADTSLTAMLADAGVSSFRSFLINPAILNSPDFQNYVVAQGYYNLMFYTLLRQGRSAIFEDPQGNELKIVKPEILTKLSESYIDLQEDPWGHPYRFWMGPQRGGQMFHRSYRVDPDPDALVYLWDSVHRFEEKTDIPGQPQVDNQWGRPAPRDKRVYIFSLGPNELVDAYLTIQANYGVDDEFKGGGDDINNWDSARGWEDAPK